MGKLADLARMTTATTGTGTITLGLAVAGYLSFSGAGINNGDIISYGIKDGNNSEVGLGVYTSSGTALTRTVTKSTNSNAAISLSGTAEVFITPRAEDLLTNIKIITITRNMTAVNGNVSYTGVGFTPRALIATGGVSGAGQYICYTGMTTGSGQVGNTNSFGSTGGAVDTNFIEVADATNANKQSAGLVSFDTDGFTLSWTLVGSPAAGTATFFVLCVG